MLTDYLRQWQRWEAQEEDRKRSANLQIKLAYGKILDCKSQMSCKEHMASLCDVGLHRRGWQETWRGLCCRMQCWYELRGLRHMHAVM